MARIGLLSLCTIISLLTVGRASAHHSVAAEFDTSLQGKLEGEITQVWFTNPHIRYQLTVTNKDGSTENWELQGGNTTNLRRQNWTAESIKVGDHVTASGDFGRGGAHKLRIQEIVMADGRSIPPRNLPRQDRNVVNASPDTDYSYPGPTGKYPLDISGPWRNNYKWHVTVDDLEPKPTPFTAEGRQIFAATEPWQDPALRCTAMGLPREFGAPYDVDIVDAGSHYLMVYVEHNMPRRIWMNGRQRRPDQVATSMGFSVGHWEGRTLVVETTDLLPGWLDGSGLPMSGDGTRVVERYAFSDDGLSVDRQMTIYDPLYTEPLVRQRYSARDDGLEIVEQASCDPDSYYRDLVDQGRLEEHFNR
jgi:hypothetical protein